MVVYIHRRPKTTYKDTSVATASKTAGKGRSIGLACLYYSDIIQQVTVEDTLPIKVALVATKTSETTK